MPHYTQREHDTTNGGLAAIDTITRPLCVYVYKPPKQPVRQRTAADPEEDRFFAVSSNGWMLQCDDGGHLVTCFPNYVPAARDLRQNFSLREGDIVIATYPKCAASPRQTAQADSPSNHLVVHCPVGAARRGRSRW